MPYDFRPNIQINPQDFKRQEDPFGAILPGFLQGQNAANLLQKKRALLGAFGQMGNQPFFQQDPIAQALMPVMQADPESGMQLLPTLIAGAYKKQNQKAGQAMRTIYQDPKTGAVSGVQKPGWQPVNLPETQATTRLQSQFNSDRTQNRFESIMGLNVGKAANKIDLDEGKLVDEASQLEGYLNKMQIRHAQLYPKFGGAFKGRGSTFMSNLTQGTSSYQTPFGEIPIPGADPELKAFNDEVDGTIQLLSQFLKDKGRISDKDAEERLYKLKASITKNPAAVGPLYDNLRGILSAIKTNDINRVNRAYARIGIKTRLKPNPENAKLLMQQQMLAQMAAQGGGMPDMNSMNPSDLGGMSTEQLQMLLNGGDDNE